MNFFSFLDQEYLSRQFLGADGYQWLTAIVLGIGMSIGLILIRRLAALAYGFVPLVCGLLMTFAYGQVRGTVDYKRERRKRYDAELRQRACRSIRRQQTYLARNKRSAQTH